MPKKACDVTKGDLLITSGLLVESVMVQEDNTYVSWGERRLMDSFHSNDMLDNIYPSTCPKCGYRLTEGVGE